jgi:hypothetical protein
MASLRTIAWSALVLAMFASAPASPGTPSGSAADDPAARAWAERCVVEMTKGRDAAVKVFPAMAKDSVQWHPISGHDGTIVYLIDDDFGPSATREAAPAGHGHPKWFDLSNAEAHQKGHWFWVREYPTGGGAITFDHGPNAKVARAIAIMKQAIDRCFVD